MDLGAPAVVLRPACPKLEKWAGEPGGEITLTGEEPRSEFPNNVLSGGKVVPDDGFDLLGPIGANSRLSSRLLRRPDRSMGLESPQSSLPNSLWSTRFMLEAGSMVAAWVDAGMARWRGFTLWRPMGAG